jgi:folate-binding protein YgfZ
MTSTAHSDIRPSPAADSAAQLAALLHDVGISPLENTGWIQVTGEDRVRWLNGMVTNSIQQLKSGEGNYNFFLSVQGRIQGDAYIFAQPNALLLETASAQISNLMSLLDRFIIMDDVELADISNNRTGVAITGPKAASLLQKIGAAIEHLNPIEMQTTQWNSAEINIIHAYSPIVPHFELWSDPTTIATLTQTILAPGATLCDSQSREWLRLLEGTPLYGTDIRDRELPQETTQTRALHFAKGCYLGQEIVERIRSRGNVHRTFAAFRLEGTVPHSGATLEAEGKQVGELTSIATIPLSENPTRLALGYIRREALDRSTPIQYSGGTAIPVALPYLAPEAQKPQPASESSERV